MSSTDCKLKGNQAVADKKWSLAERYYTEGMSKLKSSENDLRVVLLSNRSLARWNLGKFREALEDAENALSYDETFEKGYIRMATALESLNLKTASPEDSSSCKVMECFMKGLEAIPSSTLIRDAMKVAFPWLDDCSSNSSKSNTSLNSFSHNKSKSNKKIGVPSKSQRDSCVPVDIRGATGPHELRINGIYIPTEELSGGWPVYRKRTDEADVDDGDVDEDDNLILEHHSGLHEWMVKHASFKGTHRSFAYFKCLSLYKPEDCIGVWHSMEDKKVTVQSSLGISTYEQRLQDDFLHFEKVKMTCRAIEIRGAMGRRSIGINGIYDPLLTSHYGGWPRYIKRLSNSSNTTSLMNMELDCTDSYDQFIYIEYNPYFKSWQLKPQQCLETNRSWAYTVCSGSFVGIRIEQCSSIWEVLEDDDFRPQECINVMTLEQWKEDDALSNACWANNTTLTVRGAVGSYAAAINGIYEPGDDFDGGYRKRTDLSCVMEYVRKKQQWQMRSLVGVYAYVSDPDRVTPDKCQAVWNVLSNNVWDKCENMSVMTIEARQSLDIKNHGVRLSEAVPLDIRGATGVNAFKINGVYEPTMEIASEWPVYQRKGSFDYWLEFNGERGNWQIKSAANRGMDSAFAYVDAIPPTGQRPELCEGPWWVYTGSKNNEDGTCNGWEAQRSVSVLTVEQRLLEDRKLFEIRRKTCVPVDIRGAVGPRSSGLNGIFDPTEEMHGGWPVYRKRDDGDWWLEYDACPQKWMVRPTACRGTTRGRAYILCDPNLRPEQAQGIWRMSDGRGGWAIEPAIFVRPESEAKEEDHNKFTARYAAAVTIDLRGVPRPMSYINGVYEPTSEACYGWSVYKKKSSDHQWLEYHLPSKEWQIKPTSCKGTKKNWAYISSEPTHPELVTGSHWMVLINGVHVKQESVSLVSLDQRVQDDRILADSRRPSCQAVVIMNAVGTYADYINGAFEPSPTKSSGGWPTYIHMDEDKKAVLEFNVYALSWTITAIITNDASPNMVGISSSQSSNNPDDESESDLVKLRAEYAEKKRSKLILKDDVDLKIKSSKGNEEQVQSSKSKSNSTALASNSGSSSAGHTSCVLVAFVEMVKPQRPEQHKESLSPWKVLQNSRFEAQEDVQVLPLSVVIEKLNSAASSSARDTNVTSTTPSSCASTVNLPEQTTTKSSSKKSKKSKKQPLLSEEHASMPQSGSSHEQKTDSAQISKDDSIQNIMMEANGQQDGEVENLVVETPNGSAVLNQWPSTERDKKDSFSSVTTSQTWTKVKTKKTKVSKIDMSSSTPIADQSTAGIAAPNPERKPPVRSISSMKEKMYEPLVTVASGSQSWAATVALLPPPTIQTTVALKVKDAVKTTADADQFPELKSSTPRAVNVDHKPEKGDKLTTSFKEIATQDKSTMKSRASTARIREVASVPLLPSSSDMQSEIGAHQNIEASHSLSLTRLEEVNRVDCAPDAPSFDSLLESHTNDYHLFDQSKDGISSVPIVDDTVIPPTPEIYSNEAFEYIESYARQQLQQEHIVIHHQYPLHSNVEEVSEDDDIFAALQGIHLESDFSFATNPNTHYDSMNLNTLSSSMDSSQSLTNLLGSSIMNVNSPSFAGFSSTSNESLIFPERADVTSQFSFATANTIENLSLTSSLHQRNFGMLDLPPNQQYKPTSTIKSDFLSVTESAECPRIQRTSPTIPVSLSHFDANRGSVPYLGPSVPSSSDPIASRSSLLNSNHNIPLFHSLSLNQQDLSLPPSQSDCSTYVSRLSPKISLHSDSIQSRSPEMNPINPNSQIITSATSAWNLSQLPTLSTIDLLQKSSSSTNTSMYQTDLSSYLNSNSNSNTSSNTNLNLGKIFPNASSQAANSSRCSSPSSFCSPFTSSTPDGSGLYPGHVLYNSNSYTPILFRESNCNNIEYIANEDCYSSPNCTNKIGSINYLVGKLSHRNVFIKKFVATTSADNSKMKKIKSNFNRTPDNYLKLQSLFMREVRVLSDCSHPNIIPIIGYCFRPLIIAYPYIINPFVNDSDDKTIYPKPNCPNGNILVSGLDMILQHDEILLKMTWIARLRTVTSIFDALTYLHSVDSATGRLPVLHRNINPSNVLVMSTDGTSVLTGFQYSHEEVEEGTLGVNINGIDDDLEYELLRDQNDYLDPKVKSIHQYDVTSDMYSAGVILLQLLFKSQSLSPRKHIEAFGTLNALLDSNKAADTHAIIAQFIDIMVWPMPVIVKLLPILKKLLIIPSVVSHDSHRYTSTDIALEHIQNCFHS